MNGDSAINVTPRKELLKAAVHANARDLGRLLVFSACLLLCILVIKIQQTPTFEIAKLKFATMHAWIVIAALTVFHEVLARYFNSAIDAFDGVASDAERRELFEEITISGPPFFRRFKPRVRVTVDSRLYRASPADPTVWLYFFAALLIPLASFPFESQEYGPMLLHVAIAFHLLVWNWIVGTSWAIPLGNLAVNKVIPRQASERSGIDRKYPTSQERFAHLLRYIWTATALLALYIIGLILIAIYVYMQIRGPN
jgi:hypothetical protein